MHYFAQQDPQGSRLLFILTSFRDVVQREQGARVQQTLNDQQAQAQTFAQAQSITMNDGSDPMGNIFKASKRHARGKASVSADPDPSRHSSAPDNSTADVTTMPPLQHNSSNETLSPDDLDDVAPRNHSLDAFFDLARVPGYSHSTGSVHDSDSLCDAEIDFESLWQWPNSNGLTGLTPGLGPGIGLSSTVPMGQSSAPAGGNGLDVQSISDSSVPFFHMSNRDFGAN